VTTTTVGTVGQSCYKYICYYFEGRRWTNYVYSGVAVSSIIILPLLVYLSDNICFELG
jgi:hypothetical protein